MIAIDRIYSASRSQGSKNGSHILQALSEWAASKNCGIGLTAINSLISVDAVREFLHDRRTLTGIFAEEPIVDEREWLKFYNSPKTLERRLLKGMFDDRASEFAAVMDALRNPRGADEPSKLAALGLILGCFSKLEPATWSELLTAILDDDPLEDLDPDGTDDSEDAAVSFYFWVHLPCWFVYGKTPTKLLRELSASSIQAEQAAECLVRMDRRIVNHPKLLRWINADARIAAFRREKVRKWTGRAPSIKRNPPRLRFASLRATCLVLPNSLMRE